MMVGLPGSGKSYLSNFYRDVCGYRVHSSDAIREELSGDENNQDINAKVFEVLHNRVKEDLSNGISCVYDATNINRKKRKHFIQQLNKYNCQKTAIVVCTPYEVCLQQNNERERKVPIEVIDRMYKNFDIPFYNERWDNIELYYANDHYKNAYGHWGQFIYDTLDFDQESIWHKESLGEHCRKCKEYITNNLSNTYIKFPNELEISAALHDCGKPFVKDFHDTKGQVSSHAHYYNHENVGSYNSLFYNKESGVDSLLVAALIRWHMILHFFKDWNKETIEKYEREFTKTEYLKEFYKALKLLNKGDKEAH